MKYIKHIIGLGALILAVGCASPSNLPSGARKVGGGPLISWHAPTNGTAILFETTTGKIVATQDLSEGGAQFSFDITSEHDADALRAISPSMSTNIELVLYFVPAPKKK